MMAMMDSALAHFEQHREGFFNDLKTFLRFETISAHTTRGPDMQDCAAWICRQLASAGLSARVATGAHHPIVLADSGPAAGDAAGLTLLFYGHYDVQPTGDLKLWLSPPFEPTLREGAIFARGSADDKGQIMTHLAAMRCWQAAGLPWPVRIKFLIEGEEEIGSPHLPEFVRTHAGELSCDYVVLSDTSKHDARTPALAYSSRGLVYKEIFLEGPTRDLHSGQYGGAVANPNNVLARIIAGLHDERGRVTIPGFYDSVRVLDDAERARLRSQGLGDRELITVTGAPAAWGEEGFATAERIGARPTLDVNGLCGGYTGEGAATVIPAQASAKISMRLVADQDPQAISAAFDAAVRQACPPTVRLRIENHSACPAYVGSTDSPGMRAAIQALADTYGRQPLLTREGGSLPILPLFRQTLGAEILMVGFADPDCRLHSPNEFFHVSDFEHGTRCILRLIAGLAATVARP